MTRYGSKAIRVMELLGYGQILLNESKIPAQLTLLKNRPQLLLDDGQFGAEGPIHRNLWSNGFPYWPGGSM